MIQLQVTVQFLGTVDRVTTELALEGGFLQVPLIVLFQARFRLTNEIAVFAEEKSPFQRRLMSSLVSSSRCGCGRNRFEPLEKK